MKTREGQWENQRNRLMRLVEVLKLVPVGKSTWWAWVANGTAPKPVKLGRCTFWRYSDVISFIEGGK